MTASSATSHFLRYLQDNTRCVSLGDNFKEADISKIVGELVKLDVEKVEPIVLHINSNGGKYQSAKELVLCIRDLIHSPVYGLVEGNCFSSAFYVLQFCHRRFALSTARLLLHGNFEIVRVKIDGDNEPALMSMIQQQSAERRRVRGEIIQELVPRLKRYSEEGVLSLMREEKIMSAELALSRSMIDEVIEPGPAE